MLVRLVYLNTRTQEQFIARRKEKKNKYEKKTATWNYKLAINRGDFFYVLWMFPFLLLTACHWCFSQWNLKTEEKKKLRTKHWKKRTHMMNNVSWTKSIKCWRKSEELKKTTTRTATQIVHHKTKCACISNSFAHLIWTKHIVRTWMNRVKSADRCTLYDINIFVKFLSFEQTGWDHSDNKQKTEFQQKNGNKKKIQRPNNKSKNIRKRIQHNYISRVKRLVAAAAAIFLPGKRALYAVDKQ